METLQLAQMLADLSDLDAADPRAAHAIVSANTTIAATTSTTSSTIVSRTDQSIAANTSPSQQDLTRPQNRRVSSSSALSHTTGSHTGGSASPFDSYFARRLLTPPAAHSTSPQGSMPGTPHGNSTESDVNRASSLMALHDLRAKLKQYNDSDSLRQAREKVAALSGRQQPSPQPSIHPTTSNSTGRTPLNGRR